jgi:transcriptional regulator with XRE-family HTH domain
MPDELGPLIRHLRERSSLTQEKLAELSGISVSTIRRIENGKAFAHRLETVTKLTAQLPVTADDTRRLAAVLTDAEAVDPPPAIQTPPVHDPLAEVARELAREIGRRWQREEDQRRVNDPYPLPVRWREVPAALIDHAANIQRLGPGAEPREVDLDGDLRRVAEVYRRIPSGRLVVLGRAGSGKSVLTIRLVLDYTATATAMATTADPVPVIFSLGSWDPTAITLRDWMVDRLLRDHPDLAGTMPGGGTQAEALVDADRILPVLDGFDEIAEGLRAEALQALNTTMLPLVLTSRRGEYTEAVHANRPLAGAAALELADLDAADLADYLPRTAATTGPDGTHAAWGDVLAELPDGRTGARDVVLRVLTTPLMVSLARAVYSDTGGRDPVELLDTTRFPDEPSLEEHLLAGFVPAVYRRRSRGQAAGTASRRPRNWDPEQSRRWLGYLAHHLNRLDRDQQDLAWWRIGASLRRSTRIVIVTVVCALCVTVSFCVAGLFYPPLGFVGILLQGLVIGPVAGLAFGAMYAVTIVVGGAFEPALLRLGMPGRTFGPSRAGKRWPTARFVVALLSGALLGAGLGGAVTLERLAASGLTLGDYDQLRALLVNMLCFALVFGLAAAVAFTLVTVLEVPQDVTSAATPVALLAANRATVCGQALIVAPVIALTTAVGGGLITALLQPLLGPLRWVLTDGLFIGGASGLAGATCYALAATAWGQWALLSRVWLPLTGRLPWNIVAFLDDAYQRGVLRQTGAVYQFRHIRLQHHLARTFRE